MFRRPWLPLNALRAFEAVGKHKSFTAGAHAISVTQSAASRHVANLENLLGTKLLIRGAQGITLTDAGEAVLTAVDEAFNRLENVMMQVEMAAPVNRRALKVHFPPSFLQQLAMPLIGEFRAEFPDVALNVTSTNTPGLTIPDCNVAVTYDRPQISSAIRDLLWKEQLTPVCSPRLAALAEGVSLESFLAGQELLHVRVEGEPMGHLWTGFARQHALTLPNTSGITFDTLVLAVRYAMTGSGVALADIEMFSDDIAAGRLAAPFKEECGGGYGYYLTMAAEDLEDPAISLFRSWIITRFANYGRSKKGARSP